MGGGGAWSKDHDKILDHARGLHYDHVPGISLPDADASRETWTTAMDAFNDWKARERVKEASGQAWWQTYKGGGGGKPPGGGTKKPGPDWDNPDPGTGTGPYPEPNIYFPMLVPEYSDPQAQDWSEYMPDGQSGLLYQPWSQEYGEQFMQPNIWDYQPPELKVGRPQYFKNPLGIMDVTDYVPPSESTTTNPNNGPGSEEGGGGNMPPQSGFIIGADGKGYAVDENGMVIGPSGYPSIDLTAKHNPQQKVSTTISNAIANLLGINVPTISIPEYSMEDLLGPESDNSGNAGTQPGGAPSGGHHG
jgi:hypothetical protein